MTKKVYYAEDIKQSFYIICKGKIDEETKPFSFSKRYHIISSYHIISYHITAQPVLSSALGILVCVPQSS